MRLGRWSSKRNLKAQLKRWLERARDSIKSMSPREAAFVRECNVMVVLRADNSYACARSQVSQAGARSL